MSFDATTRLIIAIIFDCLLNVKLTPDTEVSRKKLQAVISYYCHMRKPSEI